MKRPRTDCAVLVIGVGIDTSRYGHHVTFLKPDLQPAAPPLEIPETPDGYDLLRQQFEQLRQRFPNVVFHIRLDVASTYAANLESFLRQLAVPTTITIGEPMRNKRYRDVHFPKRKSDATESYAAARFAVIEQPSPTPPVPAELRALREVASRLEAQTRQSTRHVNQLHNLLARVFPELAMLAPDLTCNWVLRVLHLYPTPAKLAHAHPDSLTAIPHLPAPKAPLLQNAAERSIASFKGPLAEELVRGLARQVRDSQRAEKRLQRLLAAAYAALPTKNHLDSIPGIGVRTAAILTAKIVSIDRFSRPDQLVGYFGVFPEEHSSGLDQAGQARAGRHMPMSKRGNDLARHYLYMASMTAVRFNPAVRSLYRRLKCKGASGNLALGHAMRKLLHLVFAIWKTGQPFDPQHYPWEAASSQQAESDDMEAETSEAATRPPASPAS